LLIETKQVVKRWLKKQDKTALVDAGKKSNLIMTHLQSDHGQRGSNCTKMEREQAIKCRMICITNGRNKKKSSSLDIRMPFVVGGT
jgi:hypothetical protein